VCGGGVPDIINAVQICVCCSLFIVQLAQRCSISYPFSERKSNIINNTKVKGYELIRYKATSPWPMLYCSECIFFLYSANLSENVTSIKELKTSNCEIISQEQKDKGILTQYNLEIISDIKVLRMPN
jgi:hypothetical protein